MKILLVVHIALTSFSSSVDVEELLRQMERKTGLRLAIRNERLAETGEIPGAGSAIARRDLRRAMASPRPFLLRQSADIKDLGNHGAGIITINMDRISEVATGRNASETLDAAMIVFHELLGHALNGFADPRRFVLDRFPDAKGDAVNYDNAIREELGLPLREQYRTEQDAKGKYFIPFDRGRVYVPEPGG
ncbi:MAG TPA: hypothetical protein VKB93_24670 [Thermoanaerobaculia bacterium]|nr:hypothetical protein [Thermoanaerobaculia bacterium]